MKKFWLGNWQDGERLSQVAALDPNLLVIRVLGLGFFELQNFLIKTKLYKHEKLPLPFAIQLAATFFKKENGSFWQIAHSMD